MPDWNPQSVFHLQVSRKYFLIQGKKELLGTLVDLDLNYLSGRMCWECYKLLRGLDTFSHLQWALGLGSLENFLELFEYSNLFNCKCHAFNRQKKIILQDRGVGKRNIAKLSQNFQLRIAMYFWDLDTFQHNIIPHC